MYKASAEIPHLVESSSAMMSISESGSYNTANEYESDTSKPVLRHQSSSFMRVCDLNTQRIPLALPPKNDDEGTKNQWLGVDILDSKTKQPSQKISPNAPAVLEMLIQSGLNTINNETMWTPDSDTEAILKERKRNGTQITSKSGTSKDSKVMIWTGSFPHQGYGHDIPAVKSEGIVGMSADKLMSLIADSGRVKEYNKNSTGRKDIQTFRNDLLTSDHKDAALTKIMISSAQPPLVRLVLEFLTLFHARKLTPKDGMGEGYICVCRAVEKTDDQYKEPQQMGGMFGPTVVRSEILLNVHLITVLPGYENSKCQMVNINHLKSSMVPSFIAKKIGLSAAIGFLNDIRALCKS